MRYPYMPYDPEIAAEICERIADGEDLISICAEKGLPSRKVVYRWLHEEQQFRDDYARARLQQAESLADEALHIARKPLLGNVVTYEKGEMKVVTADNVQRSRLISDTIKWRAAHLDSKKYWGSGPAPGSGADDRDITIHGGLPDTQEPPKS